jgi:signal peptidase I
MEENNNPTVPLAVSEATSPATGPKKRTTWSAAWEFIRFMLLVAVIVVGVRVFVAQPFVVSGTSMVPTFQNSDYLIIDELTYRFQEPNRGDVIVFHPPTDVKTYYIKRVIGLPGDTVSIANSVITITNAAYPEGKILSEDYITTDSLNDNFSVTVPEGQYFVMGDNRPASYDSRRWGLLPKDNITGRALLRLFPFNKIGVFPGEHPIY